MSLQGKKILIREKEYKLAIKSIFLIKRLVRSSLKASCADISIKYWS